MASLYYRSYSFGNYFTGELLNNLVGEKYLGNNDFNEVDTSIIRLLESSKEDVAILILKNIEFFKEGIRSLVEKNEIRSDEFILIAKKYGYNIEQVDLNYKIIHDYNDILKNYLK